MFIYIAVCLFLLIEIIHNQAYFQTEIGLIPSMYKLASLKMFCFFTILIQLDETLVTIYVVETDID